MGSIIFQAGNEVLAADFKERCLWFGKQLLN